MFIKPSKDKWAIQKTLAYSISIRADILSRAQILCRSKTIYSPLQNQGTEATQRDQMELRTQDFREGAPTELPVKRL
jgi:hypothetical protein